MHPRVFCGSEGDLALHLRCGWLCSPGGCRVEAEGPLEAVALLSPRGGAGSAGGGGEEGRQCRWLCPLGQVRLGQEGGRGRAPAEGIREVADSGAELVWKGSGAPFGTS